MIYGRIAVLAIELTYVPKIIVFKIVNLCYSSGRHITVCDRLYFHFENYNVLGESFIRGPVLF